MKLNGKIFVFGDNVNTDEIIPARYLSTHEPGELSKYCMEDSRPGFGRRDDLDGAILVAGENFGCGSSREHAPIAIKASGIACVIAGSFARIFLRNSINIGLPVVTMPGLDTTAFEENDVVDVDFESGCVCNRRSGNRFDFQPYPSFMMELVNRGGWLNYAREVLMETGK